MTGGHPSIRGWLRADGSAVTVMVLFVSRNSSTSADGSAVPVAVIEPARPAVTVDRDGHGLPGAEVAVQSEKQVATRVK